MVALLLLNSLFQTLAQRPDSLGGRPLTVEPSRPADSHAALNVGVFGTGVSLGNSARWTGVRINVRDAGVERINGVSLTLWKAKMSANRDMRVNGLGIGLVGPEAGTFRGVTLGLVGVLAKHDMAGINIGGGAPVSEGSIRGLNLGGLGVVSLGRTTGITVGGLGIFARQGIDGFAAAPLAVVSGGDTRGITLGGLGVVGNAALRGVNVAGLGLLARGPMGGINVAGLALIGQGTVTGFNAAGLAVSSKGRLGGISVGGLVVSSEESVEGLTVSGYRIATKDLVGIGVAPYNRVRGVQRGLTIGLLNVARELHGFQFGLINHAGNNSGLLRWLPLINFHH